MAIFSGFLNCFFPCSSSHQVSDDAGGSCNKEPSSKDSKKGKSKSSSSSSSGAPIVELPCKILMSCKKLLSH
ncbi:unnamed protein product [Prunus brigantina]